MGEKVLALGPGLSWRTRLSWLPSIASLSSLPISPLLGTVARDSDAHGYRDPCGFMGTGVMGAGAGHQIFTRDVPIPVWAGDGSVTRSHQSDVSAFSTHYERDHR